MSLLPPCSPSLKRLQETKSQPNQFPNWPERLQYFKVREVSADKAYLSHKNLQATAKLNAMAYIPFKINTALPDDNSIWAKMYHYFMYNREEFLTHYHKRSNVETAFSMIKGKFGDSVCSKSDIGQINEVLCKVLCHNLCVIIQAIHELEIVPTFDKENHKCLPLLSNTV